MGNFRSEMKGRFGGSRSGGRSGGFGGNRGGFGGGSRGGFGDRPRPEMHDVICDKCGKECQVPFKPSGDKPVLCSDCFRQEGGDSRSSRPSFDSRPSSGGSSQGGMSADQFKQINAKLDKMLGILEMIEFEEEEEDGEESEEGEDSDDDSEEDVKVEKESA